MARAILFSLGPLLKILPFENNIYVFQAKLNALQETAHICIRRITGNVTSQAFVQNPVTNTKTVPNHGTEPAKH